MDYHLQLVKGRSYSGLFGSIEATRQKPDFHTNDKETADFALKSGYFRLVGEAAEPPMLTGHLDREQLEGMKVDDLKVLAGQMDIDVKGLTKPKIIDAIVAQEVQAPGFDAEALTAMTDEELAAYAAENEISLEGCETREDTLRAISVALGGSHTVLDLMQQ